MQEFQRTPLRQWRRIKHLTIFILVFVLAGLSHAGNPVGIIPTEDGVRAGIKSPGYSPYAGRNFPDKSS